MIKVIDSRAPEGEIRRPLPPAHRLRLPDRQRGHGRLGRLVRRAESAALRAAGGGALADTCSSGTSAYSTAASFTTTASSTVTYCAANGSNRTYEWIDLIKIGSINRTSAAESGGYVNTGLSTNLVIGSTNDTIRFSAGFASTIYTEYWKIYVDFNKNGVFTDAGELVVSGSTTGSGTYYAVFSVPSTVTAGSTRMRVVMSDASTATSCGTFTYGEVEDYTVNFTTTGKLASYAATENPGVIFNATSGKAAENEPVVAKKNLSVTKETVLTVYPNPVSNAAEIAFNLAAEGNAKIKLVDISGRTIIEKDLGQLYEGDNRYTLDNLNQLESGAYIILLDVNGKTISNKRISLVK